MAATPFNDDDTIDVESMQRYTRRALEKGVSGFLVPAMAGEVNWLSNEERRLIVEIVMDEVKGAVPIIGGATASDQKGRIEGAKTLIEMGCDGILVYIPFEEEDSYRKSVKEIAELKPGFLMLQDLETNGKSLPVPLMAELFREIEVFTWAKVETPDRNGKFKAIQEATGGELNVGSAGPGMIEGLDRGVSLWMPTLYHDIYTRVFNLYHEGKRAEATDLFNRLLPCLTLPAFHPDFLRKRDKLVLCREGIFKTTHVREPGEEIDEITLRHIEENAELSLVLSREIESGELQIT